MVKDVVDCYELAFEYMREFVSNAMFEDGEVIPEDYAPATNEEAVQVVKAVAKELPLTLQNVKLTTPDENGKMYVKSGSQYFDFLFDTLYESDLTEDFVINYVTEETKFLGGEIVNSPDGVYEGDDEIWKQLLPMIEQKDMNGMFEYYITLTGKDLRDSAENTFVYGDVKNLTPEQQAYVDSFVDRIVFYHCDLTSESWDGTMCKDSDLMYIVPVLDYDEGKQTWLLENNITEVSDVYVFEPDRCIETLTHPYLAAALHAKDDEVPALIPAWTGTQEESTGAETESPEGSETPNETEEQFVPITATYKVILTEVGPEKVKVIKVYREASGLGLKEAKDAVESAPCTVIEVTNKVDAELIAAKFTEVGATVEIKEIE